MPDQEKKIKTTLDELDDKIIDMVGNHIKRRRQHYEEAARRLHENLKSDARRYAFMLSESTITQEDFEMLMKGRWAQLKIELLAEVSVSKRKFDDIAGDMLKLTVNSLLNAV